MTRHYKPQPECYLGTADMLGLKPEECALVAAHNGDLGAASKIANRDYRLVEMYTFVAVVYFVVSYGLSSLVKILQNRIAIIR